MTIGAFGVYICLFIALYFEVFMLISFLEKRPASKTSSKPKHFPSVTVIVPCWNEEQTIAGTINSLLALEYPKEKLSIVVVNDGSSDNTLAVANTFAREPQVTILSREKGGEGKHVPLNMGVEHALKIIKSDVIGCLDADSFAAPDALLEMAKQWESDPSIMALAPSMKVYRPQRIIELMQQVEYTFGIFYKKMFDNLSAISVLPGPFSMYRREVFEQIGLFRRAYNTEDMEMTFRMHSRNLKIVNAHTAIVYTTVPSSVRALVKQRTRWSQGYLQNSRDYRYMYFNRRYGNFGLLVLPFGLIAFAAGLYMTGYVLWNALSSVGTHIMELSTTHIPLQIPTIHADWFYLDTSMLTFLVVAVLCLTFTAILLGQRIAQTKLSPAAFLWYFTLFGFVAPLWLARATWGALRAQESTWR
jgi:cellulose synthase/poly-beta-1,6-N-acetylglucosamine synthase-like glycosyltransferase